MLVKRSFIIFVILFMWTVSAWAEEYPYLFRTAYFKGRGDTGIAIAESEDAIFYNPAGLAISSGILNEIVFLSPEVEVSKDTRDVVQELTVQKADPAEVLRQRMGRPQHAAFSNFSGVIFRRLALGVFLNGAATALIYRDPSIGATESVQASGKVDGGLVFGLGEFVWDKRLSVGVMGKWIDREQGYFSANAADANQVSQLKTDELAMRGRAFGADLGVMYRGVGRTPLSFGLTVQDLGDTHFKPTTETTVPEGSRPLKKMKQTVNLGVAMQTGTAISQFRLLADVKDVFNAYHVDVSKRLHFGGELVVANFVGLTFGLNQGYPTVGAYTDLRFLRADVGFYTEELGDRSGSRPDNRYFMRVMVTL